MITFILIFSVLAVAAVEFASRRDKLRHLHVVFETDSNLVEPGETVALRFTVYNTSRWPMLYAGLTLRLDSDIRIREDEVWRRRHVTEDFAGARVDYHFYLLPRRRFSGKVTLSLEKRGLYELGKYYLEYGDYLGLSPVIRSGELDLRLICTAAACETPEIDALGGYLGDISVHRFLFEDPSLVMGYRDYSGREPMKLISWMQSAKTGRLMVRQNDHTTDRIAAVLVHMDASLRQPMERCLELVRTVCEQLESARIPYALLSNGDLFSVSEGLGNSHLFFIQRRIGLSRLTGYTSFSDLIDRCLQRRRTDCSYIVIAPSLTAEDRAALARLRRFADQDPLILYGGESA